MKLSRRGTRYGALPPLNRSSRGDSCWCTRHSSCLPERRNLTSL